MGAASERTPVQDEEGLRQRQIEKIESLKAETNDKIKASYDNIIASSRVSPLARVWKPSPLVQNITIWVLLITTCFFSVAVILEELQASWYRSPALDALNQHWSGAPSVDVVIAPPLESVNIVHKRWNITRGLRQPDGRPVMVSLINGKFPPPLLEVFSGGEVQLNLANNLLDAVVFTIDDLREASIIKWTGTDLTSASIPSGATTAIRMRIPERHTGLYRYRIDVEPRQLESLAGAFLVHPRIIDQAQSGMSHVITEEQRLLAISHWSDPSDPSTPPAILLNGIGAIKSSKLDMFYFTRSTPCRPSMHFEARKTYRLRILNTGMTAGVTVSIRHAVMTIVEIEHGRKVQPKRATSIGILRPGQGVDVLVSWASAGDDEFVVAMDDLENDLNYRLDQSFPISISGFVNRQFQAPASKHVDVLRLSPLS